MQMQDGDAEHEESVTVSDAVETDHIANICLNFVLILLGCGKNVQIAKLGRRAVAAGRSGFGKSRPVVCFVTEVEYVPIV